MYERPFFGDMMLAGIACGLRKKILVFNTNENTTHDPVSVIDPSDYGGNSNSEIPIVVAYDLVHYESLHPEERSDIEKTVRLVESYTARPSRYASEYGFTRNDMNYLISNDALKSTKKKTLANIKTNSKCPKSQQKVVTQAKWALNLTIFCLKKWKMDKRGVEYVRLIA